MVVLHWHYIMLLKYELEVVKWISSFPLSPFFFINLPNRPLVSKFIKSRDYFYAFIYFPLFFFFFQVLLDMWFKTNMLYSISVRCAIWCGKGYLNKVPLSLIHHYHFSFYLNIFLLFFKKSGINCVIVVLSSNNKVVAGTVVNPLSKTYFRGESPYVLPFSC